MCSKEQDFRRTCHTLYFFVSCSTYDLFLTKCFEWCRWSAWLPFCWYPVNTPGLVSSFKLRIVTVATTNKHSAVVAQTARSLWFWWPFSSSRDFLPGCHNASLGSGYCCRRLLLGKKYVCIVNYTVCVFVHVDRILFGFYEWLGLCNVWMLLCIQGNGKLIYKWIVNILIIFFIYVNSRQQKINL
jgi:hypothetical protein